ncbi:UNVERIFIED_CONTAM: hypothetical protein Slati_1042100 [Sesamum latifolium]|uniref:Uncharacterized protein n=1 Tax=Sesamum latifolium TaxID=2727402 RepID=A0AAW2XSX2_9LAMI
MVSDETFDIGCHHHESCRKPPVVFGSSFGALILLLHQAISAAILYDFYNYDADKKEFSELFLKFTQGLALLGALLFFIGMKNSMPRRSKRAAAKMKTN